MVNILHEANVGQHLANNLDSTVPNCFILGQESLEEMAEHPCHEAISDGIFLFVPAFSLDLLTGCQSVRSIGVWVQVK